MTFENGSAHPKADSSAANNWTVEFLHANLDRTGSTLLQKSIEQAPINDDRSTVQRAGWEDLFGSPVIDARLAPVDHKDPNLFRTKDANIDSCDGHRKTTNQKDSLDSTKEGNSVLNRLYEVAVLTPKGTVKAQDFDKTYGSAAAKKMQELGITEITKSGSTISVNLAKALHFGDGSGSIDIDKSVKFKAQAQGGEVTLDSMSGVTASSGIFSLPINRVELQPMDHGYVSGNVTAGWTETKVCATPDGIIHH